MDITLSDRHTELAKKHAAAAGFDDVGDYIQYLIEQDEAQVESEEELLRSLRECVADVAAGKNTRPFNEAMADIAKQFGLSLPE